jgi:PAS domain-containing protein
MTEPQIVVAAFPDSEGAREQLAAEVSFLRAERLRLSAELERARTFERIFNGCSTAISVHSLPDLTYREVNHVVTVVSGYSHAEMIGHTPQTLGIWGATEDIERFVRGIEEKGHVFGLETSFCVRARPSQRWFRANWSNWRGAAA